LRSRLAMTGLFKPLRQLILALVAFWLDQLLVKVGPRCFSLRIVAQSARSTRTIRTLLDRLTSLPKNHLRILRNEGESLIQIFDAIRDWALLRYHAVKAVNIE